MSSKPFLPQLVAGVGIEPTSPDYESDEVPLLQPATFILTLLRLRFLPERCFCEHIFHDLRHAVAADFLRATEMELSKRTREDSHAFCCCLYWFRHVSCSLDTSIGTLGYNGLSTHLTEHSSRCKCTVPSSIPAHRHDRGASVRDDLHPRIHRIRGLQTV